MQEIRLGKISGAKFGLVEDRPFLMGLQLEFTMGSSGCGDGYAYTNNMSRPTEFSDYTEEEANSKIVENMRFLKRVLNDAKVNTVDELINTPVRITMDNSWFKSFEVLTEVL